VGLLLSLILVVVVVVVVVTGKVNMPQAVQAARA